jgi:hypothetical protein
MVYILLILIRTVENLAREADGYGEQMNTIENTMQTHTRALLLLRHIEINRP